MSTSEFQIKGIDRNTPFTAIGREDGWCDELINIRKRTNRTEPIGKKPVIYNLPSDSLIKMWIHSQDNIENWIGQTTDFKLTVINISTGSSTLIKQYSAKVNVEFIKRFMIVVYDGGMDYFLWNEGEYNLITLPSRPMLTYAVTDKDLIETEETTGASSLLGKFYKALNEQSRDGLHTGGIMFRAAFRMYDGSYFLHSIPEYLALGLDMYITERSSSGSGEANDPNTIKFWVAKAQIGYEKSLFAEIDRTLFTHVCVFACKNESIYDVSEETVTDEVLLDEIQGEPGRTVSYSLAEIDSLSTINEDFKKMVDSTSWYLVHEKSIKDIQEGSDGAIFEDIDMKDFYQDYATREALPVDQFSHHKLSAGVTYNYNSRMILGNVTTIFGAYTYFPLNPAYLGVRDNLPYTLDGTRQTGLNITGNKPVKLLVTIDTSSGNITKLIDVGERPFATDGLKEYIILANSVFGYPDTRAENIEILVYQGINWFNIGKINLTKSKYGNYSYYYKPDFSVELGEINSTSYNFGHVMVGTDFQEEDIININDYADTNLDDHNRLQISEINNPIYYPAENSYQVGTGRITDIAANTEPITEGPFGEHPLQVFTTKGRYAMIQGIGSVQFSQVVPMSGDVAEEGSVVPVSFGVVFKNTRGLYITEGRKSVEISQKLVGEPNSDFQSNPNYQFFLNDIRLIEIVNTLSSVNALTYLSGADVNFDYENNELICTNPNYNYSYVFSFDSGFWSKLDTSFKFLINYYPKLYALREGDTDPGIVNISDEVYGDPVNVLITTQPLHLGSPEQFKTLDRILFTTICEAKLNTHAGFYYFGSSDLITWQFITGRNHLSGKLKNILLQRSGSRSKYFIIVITGQLLPDSFIGNIISSVRIKLGLKIR